MRRSVFQKTLLSLPVGLLYVLASFLTGCSNNNHNNNNNHNPASITASAGATQSATAGTAFGTALAATVTDSSGSPVSGASVTFTAPSSGASGTFANGTATETDTTNSSGVATASAFTANSTTGSYTVTAAVSGVSTPASFSLTNTAANMTYVFSLSGTELASTNNSNLDSYYALVGAVTIDPTGNVVGGEEDYNDSAGVTTPAGALPITGGNLTLDGTGQGTLTLVTNGAVGVSGTETLAVQFANVNHAMIMQFDGTATSSGSLDLQTAGSGGGSYAFVLSGVDANYAAVAYGGVYSVNSGAITGVADVNDAGTVTMGQTFTGTSATADSFGRGAVNGVMINGTALTLYYYSVGPEVGRLIDMDPGSNAGQGAAMIGSAYGQGSTTTFTGSSLKNSVIGLQGGVWAQALYAVAGSIVPVAVSGTTGGQFTGIVDDFEVNSSSSSPDTTVSGGYTMSNVVGGNTINGYGTLTIQAGQLYKVSNLGVYMTDPALNLLDPNNATSGLGGALVVDLDAFGSGGTGVLVSQTDTTATNFNGNYALGAQENWPSGEYDYIGQGAVAPGAGANLAFTGKGDVSDPYAYFGTTGTLYTGINMTGTAAPDANETTNGRYTMPFTVQAASGSSFDNLTTAIYQADGTLLLFMENSGSDGLGYLEQQSSLTGLPAKRSPIKKSERMLKSRNKAFHSKHQK
jgi:hypothetical protein